jgi:hypothetical protein
MRGRVFLVSLLALTLSACGSGAGQKDAAAPHAPRAVEDWAAAVQAFGGQYDSCGARVYPTHGFYRSCMRQPSTDYSRTATAALQALSGSRACGSRAERAKELIAQVSAQLDRLITISDRTLDSARQHMPPLASSQGRTTRTVEGEVGAARVQARGC